jgi:hypothetical protein
MKFQVVVQLFAIIIGTLWTADARRLGEEHMAPICSEVSPGVYHHLTVKAERVPHLVRPHHNAIAGRCGPENCAMLCHNAKGFSSTGAGAICECTY